MRRSSLARGTKLLARKVGVKAKRATVRRSGRVLDSKYLAATRKLPCYVCGRPAPNEADHMGPRPFGRRASDDTAAPMCPGPDGCHRRRTDGFIPDLIGETVSQRRWVRADKYRMAEWCERAIAATRKTLGWVKP